MMQDARRFAPTDILIGVPGVTTVTEGLTGVIVHSCLVLSNSESGPSVATSCDYGTLSE